MRAEIDEAILRAMMESNAEGADGEWIALMGFSQGAMVAASLLLRHQLHANNALSACGSVSFRFAILMAGSAPLVSLDPYTSSDPAFVDAARYIPITGQACPSYLPCQEEHVLRLSTIHVHGLKDPGLARHRCLLNDFCAAETSMLVEWDGQHRVPIRTKDVAPVVNAIISVAVSSGALRLF
jgi:pimeloyl-ACP methyl ester carboxylesterase